jgi:hypothetical protein
MMSQSLSRRWNFSADTDSWMTLSNFLLILENTQVWECEFKKTQVLNQTYPVQTVGKLKQSPDFDHLLRRRTDEGQAGIHNHCDLGAFSYQAWLHEFHVPGNLHRRAKNHGSHLLVHKRHDMLETNPQSLSAANIERERERG